MSPPTRNERKKIHDSWENVGQNLSIYPSSKKGGGIDGRVGPRTGSSEWIVQTHYTGTRRGDGWCGNDFLFRESR